MQHIRERGVIYQSLFFNPDYQGMEVKINGYKARRLQVPALRQDFLREERA